MLFSPSTTPAIMQRVNYDQIIRVIGIVSRP